MKHYLSIILIGSISLQAYANNSHEIIYQTVENFVFEKSGPQPIGKLEVKAGPIDPQLKLATCPEPLTLFKSGQSTFLKTTSIGVRCNARNWSLYVPVKIRLMTPVLVSTAPIARKQMIQAHDLKLVETDINHLTQGYFTDPHEIIGKITRYNIQAEVPLSKRQLIVYFR